jgi:hypothetical protein
MYRRCMAAAVMAMGTPLLYAVLGMVGVVPQPALSVVPPSAVIPPEVLELDDPVAPLEEPPLPLADPLVLAEDPALWVDDPLDEPGAPPDDALLGALLAVLDEPRPEDALAWEAPPALVDESLPHPTATAARSALVSTITSNFRSTKTGIMGPPPSRIELAQIGQSTGAGKAVLHPPDETRVRLSPQWKITCLVVATSSAPYSLTSPWWPHPRHPARSR